VVITAGLTLLIIIYFVIGSNLSALKIGSQMVTAKLPEEDKNRVYKHFLGFFKIPVLYNV